MKNKVIYADTDSVKAIKKGYKMNVVVALTDDFGYMAFVLNNEEMKKLEKTSKIIVSVECDSDDYARDMFWFMHGKCDELNHDIKMFHREVLIRVGVLKDDRVALLGVAVAEEEVERECRMTSDEVYEMATEMFGREGDYVAGKYLSK